jgi:hypothetical protein
VKRLFKNRPACAALALLAAVYLAFLAADLFVPGLRPFSGFMKYAGILLCLSIALLLHRSVWNRKDSALLASALFFTAAADVFLLLLKRPVTGLLVFCAAHLVYIRRYRPALFVPAAAAVLAAAAGCLAAAWLFPCFPVKYALAGLYGLLLLSAAVCGFFSPLPRANRRLVIAGMALFLLCDIHVALFNALSAGDAYYPFAAFFMWFFYLPAQGALAVSAYDYGEPRA